MRADRGVPCPSPTFRAVRCKRVPSRRHGDNAAIDSATVDELMPKRRFDLRVSNNHSCASRRTQAHNHYSRQQPYVLRVRSRGRDTTPIKGLSPRWDAACGIANQNSTVIPYTFSRTTISWCEQPAASEGGGQECLRGSGASFSGVFQKCRLHAERAHPFVIGRYRP